MKNAEHAPGSPMSGKDRDSRIPGACWPALSSQTGEPEVQGRNPVPKDKVEGGRGRHLMDSWSPQSMHAHTHASTHTRAYMQEQAHIQLYRFDEEASF